MNKKQFIFILTLIVLALPLSVYAFIRTLMKVVLLQGIPLAVKQPKAFIKDLMNLIRVEYILLGRKHIPVVRG